MNYSFQLNLLKMQHLFNEKKLLNNLFADIVILNKIVMKMLHPFLKIEIFVHPSKKVELAHQLYNSQTFFVQSVHLVQ